MFKSKSFKMTQDYSGLFRFLYESSPNNYQFKMKLEN